MSRPCSCEHMPDTGRYQAPATLARADNPDPPPVTDLVPVTIDGDRTGGQFVPTGVEAISAPPPCQPVSPPPQRPATHPSGRRISLIRHWPQFPLNTGDGANVVPMVVYPDGYQAPVEVRGSTFRAAPDNVDPSWAEAAAQ